MEQTDQYPIPPESGNPPPEWHFSADTLESRKLARIVAVLGVEKAGKVVLVDGAKDISTDDSIGVRFRRGGQEISVSVDIESDRPSGLKHLRVE